MTDHVLGANGVTVVVRRGWEVEFSELKPPPGAPTRSLVHLANFALPADRGDYGSGAVEAMDGGGILLVLMEFDPSAGSLSLFAGHGMPTAVDAADFSPEALQRRLPGQAGMQRFFRAADRAFGLYVVLGSVRSVELLVPEANRSLGGITIG
jgi:hypothetical protein